MGDGAMSTLKVNSLATTSGVELAPAKIWGVVSGRSSFTLHDDVNISSATDSGTGRYTFTFGITLPNTNYCPTTADGYFNLNSWDQSIGLSRVPYRSTSSAGINTSTHLSGVSGGNEEDKDKLSMAIFSN
jgi:hypothetical protein